MNNFSCILHILRKTLSKWHSSTIYIVKFMTDSSLKNNGINIFSLVGIYIEKSMDIGQPTFHKLKPTRDEGSILEKAFWEMISGSVDVLPVYGFLKIYIMMVTNMKDYVKDDDDGEDDYKDDFGYYYRDNMIPQFKQEL